MLMLMLILILVPNVIVILVILMGTFLVFFRVNGIVGVVVNVIRVIHRAGPRGARPSRQRYSIVILYSSGRCGRLCHGSERGYCRCCWPRNTIPIPTSTAAPAQRPLSILDRIVYVAVSFTLPDSYRLLHSLLVSPAPLQSCSLFPARQNQPNHSGTANHAREAKHSHDDGSAFGTILSVLVSFDGPKDDGDGRSDE